MNALLIISFILNGTPFNHKIVYSDMKSCIESRIDLEQQNAANETFKAICLPFDKESANKQFDGLNSFMNAFGKIVSTP